MPGFVCEGGFCQAIDKKYRDLLGKAYADVAAAEVDTSICDRGGDDSGDGDSAPTPVTPNDLTANKRKSTDPNINLAKENAVDLLYFYVSLYLSEGAKRFVEAGKPEEQLIRYMNEGVFLKVKLPDYMQGIHANPFYLSQHRTTATNMNLHRARLLLYSWFCEYISPDAATLGGGRIDASERSKLQDYFAPGDKHTFGDKNCFDCHKRVQPLANYFGQLSLGAPYHNELDFINYSYQERLLAKQNSFDRPAGYYDVAKQEFFEHGQGNGMAALAELLQAHPQVRQCIVTSTWNNIFGRKNRLHSSEIDAALEQFAASSFSYKKLLEQLLLSDKAKAYFLEGQEALTEVIASEQETCDSAKIGSDGQPHGKSAQDIFSATCAKCHAGGANQTNFTFLANRNFIETSSEDVYNEVFNRIRWWGSGTTKGMPQGTYTMNGFPTAEKQRRQLLCYLREQAKANAITLTEKNADDDADEIKKPLADNHQGGMQQ